MKDLSEWKHIITGCTQSRRCCFHFENVIQWKRWDHASHEFYQTVVEDSEELAKEAPSVAQATETPGTMGWRTACAHNPSLEEIVIWSAGSGWWRTGTAFKAETLRTRSTWFHQQLNQRQSDNLWTLFWPDASQIFWHWCNSDIKSLCTEHNSCNQRSVVAVAVSAVSSVIYKNTTSTMTQKDPTLRHVATDSEEALGCFILHEMLQKVLLQYFKEQQSCCSFSSLFNPLTLVSVCVCTHGGWANVLDRF